MPRVAIALGSNRGDRTGFLTRAVEALRGHLKDLLLSPIYETAPMYVLDQPAYLNAVVIGNSSLSPRALLATLKDIERRVGREPAERYGPREIDLDLIGYGNLSYTFTNKHAVVLQVPHLKIPERRFVLQPLYDIDPEWLLPGLGAVTDLLQQTESQADSVLIYSDAVLSIYRT